MFGLISKKKFDTMKSELESQLHHTVKVNEVLTKENEVLKGENANITTDNAVLKAKLHEIETSKCEVTVTCAYADAKHLVDDAPCRAITAIENIKTQTDLISDKVNIKAVKAVKAIVAEFYNH